MQVLLSAKGTIFEMFYSPSNTSTQVEKDRVILQVLNITTAATATIVLLLLLLLLPLLLLRLLLLRLLRRRRRLPLIGVLQQLIIGHLITNYWLLTTNYKPLATTKC